MSNEKQEAIADDFKERPMADTKKNALAELTEQRCRRLKSELACSKSRWRLGC